MAVVKGSYVGKTMAPQYQTYQTAGLLKPTPLPSVTPAPKPSSDGGFAGVSPVNPDVQPNPQTQPTYQPLTGTISGFTPATSQAPAASGRQQLVSAMMGKNRFVPQ